MRKKLAVIMQMYYVDLWEEFRDYLQNIVDPFDLYVTVTESVLSLKEFQQFTKMVTDQFPNASVVMMQNKGLDIGPFLLTLHSILKRDVEYTHVMKLHTKKSTHTMGEGGDGWRQELVSALLRDTSKYINNMDLFKDRGIGMIGSRKWVTSHLESNTETVDHYKRKLKIIKGKHFIGGTMFCVRFEILKKYLSPEVTMSIYKELEEGYFKDWDGPTNTHALERIFGYMVEDSMMKVVGV
jgi:lipopolysaccharide biosynthesis protein